MICYYIQYSNIEKNIQNADLDFKRRLICSLKHSKRKLNNETNSAFIHTRNAIKRVNSKLILIFFFLIRKKNCLNRRIACQFESDKSSIQCIQMRNVSICTGFKGHLYICILFH